MGKLIELTRYSVSDGGPVGVALIDPSDIVAVIEVKPARGLESRSRIKFHDGEWMEIYEDTATVIARLGR